MRPDHFHYLCRLLKEQSGLVLTEDKAYLVESRLMPVARKHNFVGLDSLIAALRKANGQGALADEVTDAMTTNESFFFRDIKPFEQFRQMVLPSLIQARSPSSTIRIWSAACSSGQEPYSLAMIVREEGAKLMGRKVKILATDISAQMLKKAEAGLFSQFEVQRGLPVQLMLKYFTQVGQQWRIDPSLAEMIEFRYFNLLDDPSPLGTFDVIFCRNVLIYFDRDTKRQVLERLSRLMPDDGFLYLGGAETVLGISDRFRPIPGVRGVYTPVGEAASSAAATPPQAAAS